MGSHVTIFEQDQEFQTAGAHNRNLWTVWIVRIHVAECNMNSELRKSAGSDIKRLQEMVKRLEEQNAQLKNTDFTSSRRTPNNKVMGEGNVVKVKLSLDDVPLLDLNTVVQEDEDTWQVNDLFSKLIKRRWSVLEHWRAPTIKLKMFKILRNLALTTE